MALPTFSSEDTSRIIEMAWEDRTPFEAIETLYGLAEPDVIRFMRAHLSKLIQIVASPRNWASDQTSKTPFSSC